MSRAFYITTPIYYPNADPHIGTAYTLSYADALVRTHRARGEDSFLLTGTDEHGEKIAEAAAAEGIEPRAFVDRMAERFRSTWDRLGLRYDRFIRTTDDDHRRAVQHFWQRIHDRGDVEFRDYEGRYCVGCERYLTEREMRNGRCEQHNTEPEIRREANYFFRMSRHFEWWLAELEKAPERVQPERFRNEAIATLRSGALEDLCITRPRERLSWGIAAPWDAKYTVYVWIDALVSYLTACGYPDEPGWEERWTAAHHLIGKDILKPHAVFWPAMLHAAGVPLYHRLLVHGYWTVEGQKISKSLGTAISPLEMDEKYGYEPFRYFLLREMSFGLDADFSHDAVVRRINSDLANDLGNLLSRTLSMLQ
jgi:methionyl-tRNA synthetase